MGLKEDMEKEFAKIDEQHKRKCAEIDMVTYLFLGAAFVLFVVIISLKIQSNIDMTNILIEEVKQLQHGN